MGRMGKKLTLAILYMAAALNTFAQGENIIIKGRITYTDSQPVPYVSIRTTGSVFAGTVSDEYGSYELSLPGWADLSQVCFSAFGCIDKTVSVAELRSGTVVMLEEITTHIQPVIVKSARGLYWFGGPEVSKDHHTKYRLQPGMETGIIVINKKKIRLRSIMIDLEDTPNLRGPVIVRIKQGPAMNANRAYRTSLFRDVVPEAIIFRAGSTGMNEIDLGKYDITIKGNFLITVTPASDSNTYKYTRNENSPVAVPGGRISWIEREVCYYGPVINAYPTALKDIFLLVGNGENYSYSNVNRVEVYPPKIAVSYTR